MKLFVSALQLLEAPVRMRGWQGIFHLDPSLAKRALANLKPLVGPKPVRFVDHIPLEKLQNTEGSRSTSRGRGRLSKPDLEGKENEGARGRTGSQLFSSKVDTQTGGTDWGAVLPPRALAARAALINSMGRGRTLTRESNERDSSAGSRGRPRATCQSSGAGERNGDVGVDGSGEQQEGPSERARSSRAGKRGGRRGRQRE